MFAKILLAAALFLTACSSGASLGPQVAPATTVRHFTRLGFATNCLFVADVAGTDQWGGVPGASRNGKLGSSCLRSTYDHSVILAPQMSINGQPVTPGLVFVYTLPPNHSVGTPIKPPGGLALDGTRVQWACGPGTPRHAAPYVCAVGGRTQAWVSLPDCLPGPVDPPCIAGATQLPEIQLQFAWDVLDATKATFTGGSFHASWSNGWIAPAIDSLMANCIVIPTACGSVVNYFHDNPLPK